MIDLFDKALQNAIIHDDLDPRLKYVSFRCDKCQSPVFYEVMSEEYPLPNGRMNIRILLCPECGARELDCFTTHYLPDYLPDTILPFIGHFMMFSSGVKAMMEQLEVDKFGAGIAGEQQQEQERSE